MRLAKFRGEERRGEAHIVACFEREGERSRQISHPDQIEWKDRKEERTVGASTCSKQGKKERE